jgi:hypothetical protein
MVGERFGQSLDIGKELEAEKQEKEQELPCGCDVPPPKKDNSAQSPEKKEETSSANAETGAEKSAEPEKIEPETMPDSEKPQVVEAQPEKTSEEQQPEEREEPEEEIPAEKKEPDPVEEDVNEIMTKDFPVIKYKTSIWRGIAAHSLLFWVVFFVVVGGMFVAWKLVLPEKAQEDLPVTEYVPIDSVIGGNTTDILESVPEIITSNVSFVQPDEAIAVPETAESPAVEIVQENTSAGRVDELADVLALGLKD